MSETALATTLTPWLLERSFAEVSLNETPALRLSAGRVEITLSERARFRVSAEDAGH